MEGRRALTWNDLGFGLLNTFTHALTYRTAVVRESACAAGAHVLRGLHLRVSAIPVGEDHEVFGYAVLPLFHRARRAKRADRCDDSPRRPARLVNQCMVRATPERDTVPDGLYRYMIHFLAD